MKKIPLISLLTVFLSVPAALATVGGPDSIADIYYHSQKQEIRYVYQLGGEIGGPPDSDRLMTYQLSTGKVAVVEKGVNFKRSMVEGENDFYEEKEKSWGARKKDFLEKQTVRLKKVNLHSIDLKFKTALKEIKGASIKKYKNGIDEFVEANPSLSRDEVLGYMGEYLHRDSKMLWSVTPVYEGKPQSSLTVSSCIGGSASRDQAAALYSNYGEYTEPSSGSETFRAYSSPDLDFLVLLVTVVDSCYETGYTTDQLFVLKDIDASKIQYAIPQKDDNDTMIYGGGIYQEFAGLEKLPEFLNSYGFELYKHGDYDTATAYFDLAYTDNYLLPLYNASATEAKTRHADSAFTRIEKLLSYKESRQEYLAKIEKDADFNTLRKDLRYTALFSAPREEKTPEAPKTPTENPEDTAHIPTGVLVLLSITALVVAVRFFVRRS